MSCSLRLHEWNHVSLYEQWRSALTSLNTQLDHLGVMLLNCNINIDWAFLLQAKSISMTRVIRSRPNTCARPVLFAEGKQDNLWRKSNLYGLKKYAHAIERSSGFMGVYGCATQNRSVHASRGINQNWYNKKRIYNCGYPKRNTQRSMCTIVIH